MSLIYNEKKTRQHRARSDELETENTHARGADDVRAARIGGGFRRAVGAAGGTGSMRTPEEVAKVEAESLEKHRYSTAGTAKGVTPSRYS